MAKDTHSHLTPLTRSRVALLKDLARAITTAVLQDDLDRADTLLDQRQMVLSNLDWSMPEEDLGDELKDLWDLDQSLMNFCRNWREALCERLRTLNQGQHLRRQYAPHTNESRFIDMRK